MKQQATDQPVLAPHWVCIRNALTGSYALARWDDARGTVTALQQHVVDDFGQLQPLDAEQVHARWTTWVCSEDFEPAGTAWWEARMAEARAEALREGAARATRALLRPAPVQVAVELTPADMPSHAALITVGADERLRDAASHTPCYQVRCDHQVMTLSHAQLCALVLGAQQLIASTQRPRGARVQ